MVAGGFGQKVAAARLWAASRFPYLASALFATRIIATPDTGAAAVDERWNMYFDPEVVAALTVEELGSILVHHTGHLLRDHAGRARSLGIAEETSGAWITAADAEINDDLAEELRFSREPVTPTAVGLPEGKFAEEYFHALKEDSKACDDCGSGADSRTRSWDQPGGIGDRTAGLLRCQTAAEIMRHCQGKAPGTVPLGLMRWAEEVLRPRVDWRRALAAEIRSGISSVAGKVDYTYRRPSRRQSISPDIVLPSLHRPVPDVAVVIDTSGSMSGDLLGSALTEIEGLIKRVGLARHLTVLSCDAVVHKVQKVSSAGQVELFGGGGTDMGRGISAAAALRPAPSVVVVLTDGYTPWPSHRPKGITVVVGLLASGGHPPPSWARTIRIEDVA